MSSLIFWQELPVPFERGETLAAALLRSGIFDLGSAGIAVRGRVFCGIGACQSCLIAIEGGVPVEACLTLAEEGMRAGPIQGKFFGGQHG
jgi:hypothetical protein